MSDGRNYAEILDYIASSKTGVLTYVREDLAPVSRAMGSFTPDGIDLIFSTRKVAAKVREITRNKRVSFFFEHENQTADAWMNVLLIGDAEHVTDESDLAAAVERLSARSPRFRERIAQGELRNTAIFRVRTKEVEYLDRSKGYGFVQKIVV